MTPRSTDNPVSKYPNISVETPLFPSGQSEVLGNDKQEEARGKMSLSWKNSPIAGVVGGTSSSLLPLDFLFDLLR